jgi:hypothetical protein
MKTFFKSSPDDLILTHCQSCLNWGRDKKKDIYECMEGEDLDICRKHLSHSAVVMKNGRLVNNLGRKEAL